MNCDSGKYPATATAYVQLKAKTSIANSFLEQAYSNRVRIESQ